MRASHCIAGIVCLAVLGASVREQSVFAQQISQADSTVARYCAVWGTIDPAAREAILAEVWAESGEYVDPQPTRVTGRAALAAEIVRFQRENPGSRFRCGTVQAHHGYVRYAWVMIGADGAERFQGMDFGEFDPAGRLVRIVSFFGAASLIK